MKELIKLFDMKEVAYERGEPLGPINKKIVDWFKTPVRKDVGKVKKVDPPKLTKG